MTFPSSQTQSRRTEAFLRLARSVGALLHESQRERGVSALHVKSGRRLFASELAAARSRTDARRRGAADLVETVGAELMADVRAHVERIAAAGEDVTRVRAEMERHEATPARVVQAFTALNSELLSTVDDSVARVEQEEARTLALASLSLLYAKEKTGLERARLGAAFVGGGPDESDRLALAELVSVRATYLHMYSVTAPSTGAQMLRRVLASPSTIEVRRIEERVMGLGAGPQGPVDAGAWFRTISRTIELMGDVADATFSFFPGHQPGH
jgi:methyl-accepting chemotaxis protein